MIEQISSFFNIEMIYLWLNFGVLPFWITLIFFPQSRTCSYLVTSVFPFFLLSLIYSYLLYLFFMNGYDFSSNFLLLLWIHFLAVNLFCGCWIVKDSLKFNISKYVNFFPLVITYFIGPIGIFIYWLIRIISAKKISLFD